MLPRKPVEDAQMLGLLNLTGRPGGVPGCWLQPGPALVTVAVQELNQWME